MALEIKNQSDKITHLAFRERLGAAGVGEVLKVFVFDQLIPVRNDEGIALAFLAGAGDQ